MVQQPLFCQLKLLFISQVSITTIHIADTTDTTDTVCINKDGALITNNLHSMVIVENNQGSNARNQDSDLTNSEAVSQEYESDTISSG